MRKMLTVLAALAMVATMTGTALAQDDAQGGAPEVVELHTTDYGVGAIWARGTGNAELAVEYGAVAMRINGDVTVAGGINVGIVDGEFVDGDIRLQNFDGVIYVQGTDMEISADGTMGFHGMGRGRAQLTGQGRWKTLHHHGVWRGTLLDNTGLDNTGS